jgi:hypothetical protein
LNGILTGLFDALFWPFLGLEPIWALIVISFVTGILMLWIFGKVSNQEAIRSVRDRIRGNLIGIRLFGDDLGILLRLQGRILRQTATYLGHSLVPVLVMLVPVVLILTQMNLRFSVRPLEPGEQAVVSVRLRDASPMRERIRLEVPDGIALETPGVRIDDVEEDLREVAWRIRAEEPGEFKLRVDVGGDTVEKELSVGGGWGAVSALRTGRNFWEVLLWPGERPIASSAKIESIKVTYASLPLNFLFWDVNAMASGWLIFFFIASIVFGYAFRRVLGVEI